MPVSVPVLNKQPAHPVIKHLQSGDADHSKSSAFANLTHSLPIPPPGPPPSFGSREDWISSLPSWRRNKSRHGGWEEDHHIVENTTAAQNFQDGLTAAEDAAVIKGMRAQACLPPISALVASLHPQAPAASERGSDEMDVDEPLESTNRATAGHDGKGGWYKYGESLRSTGYRCDPIFEKGAFTPVFEDASPDDGGRDQSISPLSPVTPFADFVDRAVADAQVAVVPAYESVAHIPDYYQPQGSCIYQTKDTYYGRHEHQPQPIAEPSATPTVTPVYKKMAEPLAEWISGYVWKVCTTGMGLPASSVHSASMVVQYSAVPPSYLAGSVRSLFLSTLLQPYAIFLATWYIVRLPVYFGSMGSDVDDASAAFRDELLGDTQGLGRDAVEAQAPFRLVLLGCMLANKWLDDHTFSNKTWHTISNVPIRSLNRLEFLALHCFSHDLSVEPKAWSEWLSHLMAYHLSLSSPQPQPISRPSTSPHGIVRKKLEELVQASSTGEVCSCNDECCPGPRPEPTFLGLDERRRDREEGSYDASVDMLEIDLDEDGPLREEYLPKRRTSRSGSERSAKEQEKMSTGKSSTDMDLVLPPPAKWSPAGDEPIMRDQSRVHGQYLAMRPQMVALPAPYHIPPPPYRPVHEGYHPWSGGAYVEQQVPVGYGCNPAPVAYNGIDYAGPDGNPLSRSRSLSHSLAHERANAPMDHHVRSQSQSRFNYGYSDLRSTTSNEYSAPALHPVHWAPPPAWYGCPPSYDHPHHFMPGPPMNYQTAWLRA